MYAIFRNFIQVVYDAVWDQTLLYIYGLAQTFLYIYGLAQTLLYLYGLAQQSSLKIKNGNLMVATKSKKWVSLFLKFKGKSNELDKKVNEVLQIRFRLHQHCEKDVIIRVLLTRILP